MNDLLGRTRFYRFFTEKLFIDFTIKCGTERIMCHKIVLVQSSKYFSDFFSRNPFAKEIEIPYYLDYSLSGIIESCYSNRIEVDIKSVIPVLKYSSMLGIVHIYNQCKTFLIAHLKDSNRMKYAAQLCNLGLSDVISNPESISYFSSCLKNHAMQKKLFSAITPDFFVNLMGYPDNSHYSNKQKICLIEVMYQVRGFISDECRDSLASLIDWNEPDSYLYFMQYDLLWVPDRIARPFIGIALNNRISTVSCLCNEFKTIESTNSLYLMSWASFIYQSKPFKYPMNVEALSFISTQFGICRHFNIADYGLIQLTGSSSLSPEFELKKILEPDMYYCSQDGSSTNHPYIVLSFGSDVRFRLQSITVNSDLIRVSKAKRGSPKVLHVDFGIGRTFPSTPLVDIKSNNDICYGETDETITSLKISMISESSSEWWNLRIKSIELNGHFLPN